MTLYAREIEATKPATNDLTRKSRAIERLLRQRSLVQRIPLGGSLDFIDHSSPALLIFNAGLQLYKNGRREAFEVLPDAKGVARRAGQLCNQQRTPQTEYHCYMIFSLNLVR